MGLCGWGWCERGSDGLGKYLFLCTAYPSSLHTSKGDSLKRLQNKCLTLTSAVQAHVRNEREKYEQRYI
jgi:hypothetical protein